MKHYNHNAIEPKWQARWEEAGIFEVDSHAAGKKKKYVLDMFPYPSGAGLHVGHLLGYTGSDVLSRHARMQGYKVLHPMGWDAFGLPAENYAIKTGVHPAISTKKNIQEFIRQFKQVGYSYDWSKELSTAEPEYYKWTQWFFSLLYERGLAYRKDGLVNWCPSCQTVLANEQVVGGACERCGSTVVQRQLKQWYFKITDYAERLLNDLDGLDWPEQIKTMQRNWIGRSSGARMWFRVCDSTETIEVFTTRPDTIYGATYMVLAPEHPLLDTLVPETHKKSVDDYKLKSSKKTELERTFLTKEKTGVFSGAYAINPATGTKIPIWVADYVISTYGTGAIMAVPAHDERDQEFAEAFDLPSITVIAEDGTLVNSGEFSGKKVAEALDSMLKLVGAEKTTTYRLRDWLVSRQRFWGSPIPIAYDSKGEEHLIPLSDLPVTLPMNIEFKPTGKSPLADAAEWRQYKDPKTKETWEREADTLDTFVCSSWYYLRFPNPHYDKAAFDPEAVKSWLPVDTYIGGAEHAVLHLLYARFFTKVLFDAGYIDFQEPFQSLRNQGMILGPDHAKMSKSKGNVVNPDDVIKEYGADTLRMYELFMAPFEQEKPWNTKGIVGVRRFLDKVWRLQESVTDGKASDDEKRIIHRAIKEVTDDLEGCRFNTAIAFLMETVNDLSALDAIAKDTYVTLITIMSPFAPHISEELWAILGQKGFVSIAPWPAYDEKYLIEESSEYVVQINGKVRARINVPSGTDEEEMKRLVHADSTVSKLLEGKKVEKVIIVPGRLVSLVVK